MHRGRFGGNARKRKAKLTDATFHAMIGAAPQAEAPVATLDLEANAVTADVETVSSVVVTFDAADLVPPRPATRAFTVQEYQFGYAACANCHNDQAYYLHQSVLAGGYTFRCRICRLEMTVVGEE